MRMFRTLRADEIDCRIAQIKGNGLSLLLYKDARCDQNILDETVGEFGWMRSHSRENANCTVSLWDKEKAQWISKEDTGTESNTEAAKGLASDSFKRACFNWGIGRELYSAPFIWIPAAKCEIKTEGGRTRCYDKFIVRSIEYRPDGARDICGLVIYNASKKVIAFEWHDTEPRYTEPEPDPEEVETKKTAEEKRGSWQSQKAKEFCEKNGLTAIILGQYKKQAIAQKVIPDKPWDELNETEIQKLFAFVEILLNARQA